MTNDFTGATSNPETATGGTDDRRAFDRSRLIVDVYFDGNDATGIASTKDISAGGLYMNTQANLPEGAVLLLRIPLGGTNQIVVNAEVVYSNQGRGVGVRFHNMPAESRKALELALTDREL